MRVLATTVLAVMSLVLGVLGCGGEKNASPPEATALTPGEPVDTSAAYFQLRFPDGLVTWNNRCPIRLGKLHARMKPLYVNGRPVGFC